MVSMILKAVSPDLLCRFIHHPSLTKLMLPGALTSRIGTLSLEKQEKLEADIAKAEKKAEKKAEAEAKRKEVSRVQRMVLELCAPARPPSFSQSILVTLRCHDC